MTAKTKLRPETLGQRVKRLRLRAGLSQGKLAQQIGSDVSLVAGLEQGKRGDIMLDTGRKLATALGVSLDELAG